MFRKWAEKSNLRLENIRPFDIRRYIVWQSMERINRLNKKAGLAKASINRRSACLKTFYEYLIENDLYHLSNPVRKGHFFRNSHRLPRPLLTVEASTLIDGTNHVRDKALFSFYLDSGMRLRELLRLNESDIKVERCNYDQMPILIGKIRVLGKGNKERLVYVSSATLETYMKYLKVKPAGSDALFVNKSGDRLTANGARDRLLFWCKKLGLSGVHVHRFRHTFATRQVENGMRIEHLASLMGHSDINTTKKYVYVSPQSVKDAFVKINVEKQSQEAQLDEKEKNIESQHSSNEKTVAL